MGTASMVIGIIAVILGFVPFCNYLALVPAGIGLILGIVEVSLKTKKQESKRHGITGIVLNSGAIAAIVIWTVVIGTVAIKAVGGLEGIMNEMKVEIERAADRTDKVEEENHTE